MATNTAPNTAPKAIAPVQSSWRSLGIGVALIVIATIVLFTINRTNLLFELWSALAFPVLVITPFVLLGIKVPNSVKAFVLAIVILLVIPYLGIEDTFYLELATQIGIFAAMALGLNIVVGFAGLLDLGYVAFFAVGAYLWGIFTSNDGAIQTIKGVTTRILPQLGGEWFWPFIIFGVIAAGLFGVLLGLPVLRLKGDYLAIVTLGFGEVIRILVSNLSNVSSDLAVKINLTNGAQGLSGIIDPPLPAFFVNSVVGISEALGPKVANPTSQSYAFFFYFFVLLLCGLFMVIASRLENSPVGRAWTAIREDETAAIAMGVPLVRMKLLAFAMGASFAGAMGVIYAAKQTFVSPESFSFNQSIFILVIVIVGGMGSIRGVVLGAAVVTLLNLQVLKNLSLLIGKFRNNLDQLPEWLRPVIQNWNAQLEPARYERLIFGLLLVMMMIWRPGGLIPASRRKLELQAAKEKQEGE